MVAVAHNGVAMVANSFIVVADSDFSCTSIVYATIASDSTVASVHFGIFLKV